MNVIKLRDRSNNMTANIYPEYGGMLGNLNIGEVNILKLDESKLGFANVLAGGNPILFPFSGKTQDNRYKLNNKLYYVPMHGFVKDIPFAVEEVTDHSATLWIDSSDSLVESSYPFKFTLKVKYILENNTLRVEAT